MVIYKVPRSFIVVCLRNFWPGLLSIVGRVNEGNHNAMIGQFFTTKFVLLLKSIVSKKKEEDDVFVSIYELEQLALVFFHKVSYI
jgi:hypothetical protein